MRPLSDNMKRALYKLSGEWQSAYDLRENRSTLHALAARGLAHQRADVGSMYSPSTGWKFRLSNAGRELLSTEPTDQ